MTQDIHQLIARAQAEYVRCIDDGDLGQWPEFFTTSCVYRVTTADNHRRGLVGSMIYAASQGMLVDRVKSLRDATTDLFATGRYCDVYVRDEAGVRLRERVVLCDSSRIDTLLALPL